MENRFDELIDLEKQKPYFKKIETYLDKAYQDSVVFPSRELLFNAFNLCNYDDLKVVILGQDPYHELNQAMGLAFSVPQGVKLPPSLVNIYKELASDLKIKVPTSGDLSPWAKQGVLLLNTVLSVRQGEANSHKDIGWLTFSDHVLSYLNNYHHPLVFILWGKPAQEKAKLITNPQHHLIKSVHPSPLSAYRGFFGSKPFSKANAYLKADKIKTIDWSLK